MYIIQKRKISQIEANTSIIIQIESIKLSLEIPQK
jgi:hypothetical protein